MRLAITVDSLGSQLGGIGRYTLELCKGLQNRPDVRSLVFYRNGRWIKDPYALLRDEEILNTTHPFVPKLSAQRLELKRFTSHLFHGTNFFLPREAALGVLSIHDLSVMRFPELHPAARLRAFENEFMGSVERAAHIITPSHWIRQEVIHLLGCKPEKVTAIPLAADGAFRPRTKAESTKELLRWGLRPGGYGLSVATIEPRKKLEQSLEAWGLLPTAVRRRWPLVVVGGEGWGNSSIRSKIRRGVAEGWVRDLGYVSEDSLPYLYSGSRLLIYPSTYEGFGLPAVEAMASGIPCLISGQSCLTEVTQGAAMVVEPDDVISFAGSIERALTDDDWRAVARRSGLSVAAGYSWGRCISETMDVYKNVLTGPKRVPSIGWVRKLRTQLFLRTDS